MTEVSETLKKAYVAVTDAKLPEHLHKVAFQEAVRLLMPAAPPVSVVRPTVPSPASKSPAIPGEEVPEVPEALLYDRIVAETGADRAKVEQLIHLDNNVPVISIPGIRLGKNNAEKTRVIAQVLTIARGFGLGEPDTSIEVVRNEAIRFKCYDSANFAGHLSTLEGYVITGSGKGRRIRAKNGGVMAFPALVDSLIEGP